MKPNTDSASLRVHKNTFEDVDSVGVFVPWERGRRGAVSFGNNKVSFAQKDWFSIGALANRLQLAFTTTKA